MIIIFQNVDEIQEAYKCGVLPHNAHYYEYIGTPRYNSFPTLFWFDEFDGEWKHQSNNNSGWSTCVKLLAKAKLWFDIRCEFKPKLKDKQLVWAWNDGIPFMRCVGFYDAKSDCLFESVLGRRDGEYFSNYEFYEGEWPEWAKKAVKKLDD